MVREVPEEYKTEALRLVQKFYGSEVDAWLVGSRVDGEPDSDSDLDVVVQTTPMHHKKNAPKDSPGAGRYIEDTEIGIPVDISEDEDGPVWFNEDSQVRIQ